MASKVIGFRVPEDLAEELEKVSEECGITVAQFLRSLVDEMLYPATELHDEESDGVIREQIESLSNSHGELAENVQELSSLVDRIGVKIAGYEIDGILSSKMVETIQEIEAIKRNAKNLEDKVDTLSIKLESAQDTIELVNEYKTSSDRSFIELKGEINSLRSQLGPIATLSTKVEQLELEVTRLTTNTTKMKSIRQPTDETRTLAYKDNSEHRFRVYKSPAGLVKPRVVVRDLIQGNKYIDETEPLD